MIENSYISEQDVINTFEYALTRVGFQGDLPKLAPPDLEQIHQTIGGVFTAPPFTAEFAVTKGNRRTTYTFLIPYGVRVFKPEFCLEFMERALTEDKTLFPRD